MRYLYQYTCPANYPVIAKAMVVFHSSTPPSKVSWPNLIIEGTKLADKAGCSYASYMSGEVAYLGQIEPVKDFKHQPVLLAVTGEY